jgi:hypothetical protein
MTFIRVCLILRRIVMLYVRIENPVNTPISSEFWTIWGSSTKREVKHEDKRIIGQFGSGGNHAIALCLRQSINPVIFNENQKLEFFTQPIQLDSINGTETQYQVGVNHSGKDSKGRSVRRRDILNHTLSFGSMDWTDISFAMREFISNAIDACYLQGLGHTDIKIDIVPENQVRAKSGTVRVFVPVTPAIQSFCNNIGSWFLHFSNPELLLKTVFARRGKNIESENGSMIYRRGVLVCEVNSREEALYDYNVDDIQMNESRSVDSWTAMQKAASSISDEAETKVIIDLIKSLSGEKKYWEHNFPNYHFSNPNQERKDVWKQAWENIYGQESVIANSITASMCRDKGYKPVSIPENYSKFLQNIGIKSDCDVLSCNELQGKKITDPSKDFVAATQFVWNRLQMLGFTNDRPMPSVKGFDINQNNNTIVFGFWENDTVAYNNEMSSGLNEMLLQTVIEELTHHITKANDGSRDFQNYLIKVIAKTLFKDFGK